MRTLFTLLLAALTVYAACPSGEYEWLGACCDPATTCPPGVPAGQIQPWLNRDVCLEATSSNSVVLDACDSSTSQIWALEYISGRLRLRLQGTTLCLTRGNSLSLTSCDYASTADEAQWFEYNGGLLSRYDGVWCLSTTSATTVASVACDLYYGDTSQFWVNSNLQS